MNGADGGVFTFGVRFAGSTGNLKLNAPVVGLAATPDRGGYWLVAKDGGIFAFGTPRSTARWAAKAQRARSSEWPRRPTVAAIGS